MIEIGEYGRTNLGNIYKFAWFEEEKGIRSKNQIIKIKNGKLEIYDLKKDEQMVKHSKNLVDVIEVGDYVNGYKITGKESTLLFTDIEGIDNSGYHIPISQYGENIQTILTHEQYDQNCYKVEEES